MEVQSRHNFENRRSGNFQRLYEDVCNNVLMVFMCLIYTSHKRPLMHDSVIRLFVNRALPVWCISHIDRRDQRPCNSMRLIRMMEKVSRWDTSKHAPLFSEVLIEHNVQFPIYCGRELIQNDLNWLATKISSLF